MKTVTSILCTLLWSGLFAPRSEATVYHSNGSVANIQSIHNSQAVNGDTITLPAGTFSWTSRLEITKGITLQGATTIDGAGTDNPTIDDVTIVKDDTRRTGSGLGIINVAIRSNQSFRLTGITFSPGDSTNVAQGNGAIHLLSQDSAPCTSMRVDHCHFNLLYQGKIIWVSGWVYGVADHNVFDVRNGSFPFHIWHDTWGGFSQGNGNGSWADYPWYGTEKFFFMEDNTARSNRRRPSSFVDTFYGGRWVARHNYLLNCIPNGHGTEGGAARGQRASEFYDNTVKMTVPWSGGGQRSGTSLWHDNLFIGAESSHGHTNLPNYRETPARPHPVWGIADGTSVWDQNDTDGNGHYVEGQPPYLFASGTVTTASVIVGSTATIRDSTKHWTVNQWRGYSIKSASPGSPSYPLGSYVISNTSNTITYYYYSAADAKTHLIFNAGDTYQIHRVLTMMDQNGRGKGDQVRGQEKPINSTAARPLWTHEALEPCYSWNNIHSASNRAYGFHTNPAQPTTKLGIDYFNLGAGIPVDTTPSRVSLKYTAALNGVDYTGTYIYPHPLVSSASVPTDFNDDGKPDFLLNNSSTGQTAIWYLNNDVRIGQSFGPTPLPGWNVAGVGDFNLDGHPDYLLFRPDTGQTAMWYLNNSVRIGHSFGPTLWPGWNVAGVADFNLDGHPDYLLFRPDTGQTAIRYLNNNVAISSAFGPTLWPGWNVAGVADFNLDGQPDYLLFRPDTGQTAIWYLSDNVRIGQSFGPTLWPGWNLAGVADFNLDGHPDYLLFRPDTGQTAIWYLNNNVRIGSAWGPTPWAGWRLVAP